MLGLDLLGKMLRAALIGWSLKLKPLKLRFNDNSTRPLLSLDTGCETGHEQCLALPDQQLARLARRKEPR